MPFLESHLSPLVYVLLFMEYTSRKNAWEIKFWGFLFVCLFLRLWTSKNLGKKKNIFILRLLHWKHFPLGFWRHLLHCLLGSIVAIRNPEANYDAWFLDVVFLSLPSSLSPSLLAFRSLLSSRFLKFHNVVLCCGSIFIHFARYSVEFLGLKARICQFWEKFKSTYLIFLWFDIFFPFLSLNLGLHVLIL